MQHPLSRRTALPLVPNELARVLDEKRAAGVPIIDLTLSNPTQAGFQYDAAAICRALSDPKLLRYEPSATGLLSAREAIVRYYADRGHSISPERVLLCASTSEAYGLLLKLFADPVDEVLVPQPSYPLFEHLAHLESVRLVPYPLVYEQGWRMDVETLRSRVSERSRAIFLVSPNNPTGNFAKPSEREALGSLGLPVVVDEVFLDYAFGANTKPGSFAGETDIPCVVLSGLSKVAALPQIKLGWMVVSGPTDAQQEMLARLEWMADGYLSVSTQAQLALPTLLAQRSHMQTQIRQRTAANLAHLRQLRQRPQAPIDVLAVEGGWYAMLRVPRLDSDEKMTASFLQEENVLVHPGYFFDCEEAGIWVVSLLPPAPDFAEGMAKLLRFFG